MYKRRIIISSIISIFLVSMLLLGSTYSIFTSREIDETANVYKTGNLNVTYSIKNVDGKNSVQITNSTPMTTEKADAVIPYRITVTNTGNVPYEFDVILMDTTSSEENTIDYQYIMTKVGYLEPLALSNCTNNIIKENVIVPAGESVDIDIRLWLDSTLPNTEIGKSFYAKLTIDGLAVYNDDEYIDNSKLSLRYMNDSSTNDFRNDLYRTYITTATFVDYIDTSDASVNAETNEKIMWDMSTAQDESVIAWLEENETTDEESNKYYDLYIGSKEKIYAKDLNKFFQGCSSILNINFDNLDTSLIIKINYTFDGCSSIESLDLSSFDTSNVTSMGVSGNYTYGGTFNGCSSLKYLNISSFDTSKVTSFARMFYNCSSLEELDLSHFDTSSVTDMGQMFRWCSSLTELDVSNFDTINVSDMRSLFEGCSALTELNIGNFNTSNVTNVIRMFASCSSLTQLDLSNFDTSNVSGMQQMFNDCSSLVELDVSNFNTNNVTNMYFMFRNCSSLTSLDLSHFDTSKVTNMTNMLYGCNNLSTTITIMNPNTNYANMFSYAATAEGAQIIVNYVGDVPTTTDVNESTESLVEAMIATKFANSNVVKGELVA